MEFQYKLEPFPYQREVFERSRDLKTYALFMEQGTGKTKVTADTAAWLYLQQKASCLIVVAPNGVHQQWIDEELPKHLSVPWVGFSWHGGVAPKKTQNHLGGLIKDPRLVVLAFNIESVATAEVKRWIEYFLKSRSCMLVVDEATDIKRPSALRTRTLWYLGKFARYKRILTGTPASEGPFGYYSMFRFLHWQILGYWTYAEFKADFAEWKQLRGWRDDVKVDGSGRPIMVVARDKAGNPQYKNLDKLEHLASKRSYRITKKEALPWLPPKQYDKRLFELTTSQRKFYNEIKHDYVTELDGKTYYAELAITRMLRMQQIACGYLPSDTEEPKKLMPGKNPRIEALEALLEECSGQFIIWARFAYDIDQIMELLGKRAVRYDATVREEERSKNKARFLGGEAQGFVGNTKAGGRGLNLQVASLMVFYSNYFDLEWRQQGEDRGHRPGMGRSLQIYDLCCVQTVDEYIIKRLINKQNIADTITGDPPHEWL
jgi:SNF2 family DNA or RNA helicase